LCRAFPEKFAVTSPGTSPRAPDAAGAGRLVEYPRFAVRKTGDSPAPEARAIRSAKVLRWSVNRSRPGSWAISPADAGGGIADFARFAELRPCRTQGRRSISRGLASPRMQHPPAIPARLNPTYTARCGCWSLFSCFPLNSNILT
jgi:hypothetical protein